MPIGFRREMSGVRNAQLQLAKERAKLQEAELELSHQLAFAIRDMEAAQVLSQTNFNRRIAAQRQVEAVAAAYETGTVTLDVLRQFAAAPGPGRKRLLPLGGKLQQSDHAGSLPQGFAFRVQWRVLGRRSVAGQGVLRRPAPGPGPRCGDLPRLRLHAAEGHQPRTVRTTGQRQRPDCSATTRKMPSHDPRSDRSPNWCRHPNRNRSIPAIQPAAEPTPAMPEEPKPQPEAGASASKAPVKKSTTSYRATIGNRDCRSVRFGKKRPKSAISKPAVATGRIPGSVRRTARTIPHRITMTKSSRAKWSDTASRIRL